MPIGPSYRPDPRYIKLGSEFADPTAAALFPQSNIRFRNDLWAAEVGLDNLTDEEWRNAFALFQPLPDNQPTPLAMRYHGHQFQTYNPDLGDGRGFLFAQLRDRSGRLLDLGTKGSGQTPYSRTADGRLTLKGGVREVLATAMLEAQGVSTSKSFSLVETGESLVRGDEPSPTRSAVLTRLSFSHIRFGTFQRHAYFQRSDLLETLVDHVAETYHPALLDENGEARIVALLRTVVLNTARLVASWMAAGFVHGVLNTDNMNINGESFDYGPYRFLPKNDPNFTAAYFDQTGLYAFGRQPQAVFWNLQQLAGCFVPLASKDLLVDALNAFAPAYRDALAAAMLRRFGIVSLDQDADVAFVNLAFKALGSGGDALRWEPLFFDWQGGVISEDRALKGPRGALYQQAPFDEFRRTLARFEPSRPERLSLSYFSHSEPQELLYEEIEQIWSAIADHDDWTPFTAKLDALDEARRASAHTD